jgi:hypothetical protein
MEHHPYDHLRLSSLNVKREVLDAFFYQPWVKTRIRALAEIERAPERYGTTQNLTIALRKLLRDRIATLAQNYASCADQLCAPTTTQDERLNYLRGDLAALYEACGHVDATLVACAQTSGTPRLLEEISKHGNISSAEDFMHLTGTLLDEMSAQLPAMRSHREVLAEANLRDMLAAKGGSLGIAVPPATLLLPAPEKPVETIAETPADAPRPNTEQARLAACTETLLHDRASLDAHMLMALEHGIRDALCSIALPGRDSDGMSWYKQLTNAATYRQSFLGSHAKNQPKPPSFQSTLVLKRECEQAIDHLAKMAAQHYMPGQTHDDIEASYSRLIESIEALVAIMPNATAALGSANLRDQLHGSLYPAIENGFERAAQKLAKDSFVTSIAAARSQSCNRPQR